MPHDEVEDAFLQHLREKAEERKKRQEDTDDDHFGRHVAAVLKDYQIGQRPLHD